MTAPDSISEGYFIMRVMVGYMGGKMVMMFNLLVFQKLLLGVLYGEL